MAEQDKFKENLKRFLEDQKYKKAVEEVQREGRNDEDRSAVLKGLSEDFVKAITPVLAELPKSAQMTKDMMREALSEAIQYNMPEIPPVEMPEIHIDTAGIEASIQKAVADAFQGVKIPAPMVNVTPDRREFPTRLSVDMPGVDNKRPLPVMMMGPDGKPFQFSFPSGGYTQGGKTDYLTIKSVIASVATVLINPDGTPVYSSGSALGTVSVSDIFGTVGTNVINPDGRIKVEVPTGSSGLTDTELRATAVPISQVSGASFSVSVTDIFGSTGTGFYNLDNRIRVELPNTTVQDIFTSTATQSVVNPDNRMRVELPTFTQVVSSADIFATTSTSSVVNPDNRVKVELPATTVTVTGITNTVAAANVDSSGVQYSGSNPLPITIISGALTSTIAVGDIASGTADTGSAPNKVGGIVRTTNPTAEADGDRVTFSADDVGRQVMRNVQVRDLVKTAYVSVATGTETTLLAAVAGAFLDLVMIVGSNNSDAAVSVDIRAVTGGNIVNTLRIPANGTAGWTPAVPWPQDATGNNWTVDGPDETGRTLTFSALFSQEV